MAVGESVDVSVNLARSGAAAPATTALPGSTVGSRRQACLEPPFSAAPLTGVQAAAGLAGEAGVGGGVAGKARGTPGRARHTLAGCGRVAGLEEHAARGKACSSQGAVVACK